MKFTDEQKKVIDIRDKNVLVSAAAGSGKTAVIVERIIERVIKDKVDISEMLVVTFTKAAAQEMKERIREAFEKKLDETSLSDPAYPHLERQLSLIFSAPITTIDAFCLDLIRNNFDICDVDPSFRVADEGELKMIRQDVMDELMERHYDQKDDDASFYDFLERFSVKRSDSDVTSTIEQLYDFAVSRPDPRDFIGSLKKNYEINSPEEVEKSELFAEARQILSLRLRAAKKAMERALEIARGPLGPEAYIQNFEADIDMLGRIDDEDSFAGFFDAFSKVSFAKLSPKKSRDEDAGERKRAKDIRDRVKGSIEAASKKFFSGSMEGVLDEIKRSGRDVEMLVKLTMEFFEDFSLAKEKKSVMDFSDIEHTALNILKNEGVRERYKKAFKEIIIDEYQDSNRVQEEIFRSISDGNDYFCVGDVKQSIYSFRDACPELFTDKYAHYGKKEGGELLLLSKNFRSRKAILDSTNVIFEKIMHEDVGGVEYDRASRLNYGELYTLDDPAGETEYMLIREDEEAGVSANETEAMAVAKRIDELVGSLDIEDKRTHEIRKCRYGDIVILMRALSGRDEEFMDILMQNGIPVSIDSRSGYLLSDEVRTLINFLYVLDNPRQDIPLAGTLLSIFGGFDESHLSLIRADAAEGSLYDALKNAASKGDAKAAAFMEKLAGYRNAVSYLSMHELLSLIIKDHGYDICIRAGKEGQLRLSNLDMLLYRASEFEKTSFKGLFRFIRYIEYMKKYEIDMKSPSGTGGDGDAVRLMTIHHSKGLEFPVVFLCGMQRQFNKSDISDRLLADDLLGAGTDIIDTKRRIRKKTFIKNVIAERKKARLIGEELRVLYVAMTRAEQKLILSAIEAVDKDGNPLQRTTGSLPTSVFEANSFGALIDFAMDSDMTAAEHIKKVFAGSVEVAENSLEKKAESAFEKKDFILKADLFSTGETEKIISDISRSYPYENACHAPEKLSVSYLKHEAMEEAGLVLDALSEEKESCIPAFVSGLDKGAKSPSYGALRGSAYHTLFEHMDMGRIGSKEGVVSLIKELTSDGVLNEKEASYIRPGDIVRFGESRLAGRMKKAGDENKLFREQPFVILVNAREIDEKYPEDERVMVQGIIDVYFEEDGKIVLMDYKTDKVKDGGELIKRYKAQLDYYAKALELLTGQKVSEEIIYSITLGEEIVVK